MPALRIQIVGDVTGPDEKGEYKLPDVLNIGIPMPMGTFLKGPYDPRVSEPVLLKDPVLGRDFGGEFWIFRGRVVRVENAKSTLRPELLLQIKAKVLRHEKQLTRIRRELEALDNMERLPSARRERIPNDVRLFVWQRDEGKCVKCRSQERLEFDHVIAVEKGGSSTARNIQLLCERCNRSKGCEI